MSFTAENKNIISGNYTKKPLTAENKNIFGGYECFLYLCR